MQKLIDGHRLFLSHVFPQKQAFFRELAAGQDPRFLFMICSDSRVQPTEFLTSGPGEIFADRSLGNVIPAPGGDETEAAAVVEYAVVALKVDDIVVCGHSQCGAMRALLDPGLLAGMPTVARWLEHARPTLEAVERKYGHLEGQALLEATIR